MSNFKVLNMQLYLSFFVNIQNMPLIDREWGTQYVFSGDLTIKTVDEFMHRSSF